MPRYGVEEGVDGGGVMLGLIDLNLIAGRKRINERKSQGRSAASSVGVLALLAFS